MRLKVSIEAGVVLPSVILRKLAAEGPSNALSRALRVLGRIERTLFTLLMWNMAVKRKTKVERRFRAGSDQRESGYRRGSRAACPVRADPVRQRRARRR